MLKKVLWGFEYFLSKKRIRVILFISLAGCLAFLHFGLPHITLTQGQGSRGELFYNNARLKLLHQALVYEGESTSFNYRIHYTKGFFSLKQIQLQATECLNDISFESASKAIIKIPYVSNCIKNGSILLDVPESFKDSDFDLIFRVKTADNARTIHVQYFYGWTFLVAYWLLLALLGLLLFSFLRFESRYIRYFLPLGFQFYASHFLSLDVDAWSYDSIGHLDHVKTVLGGNLIPKDICWECFQPPLSYWLSAFLYKISLGGSVWSVAAASRFSSLFCFVVFLYYGFKYMQLYLRESCSRSLLALLIVFLPASLIHALRVGNESFFYAAFMAALYYLSRFVFYKSFRDLKFYSWSTLLAFFSKATALVLGPISVLVLLLEIKSLSFQKNKFKYLKVLVPMFFFLALFVKMQRYKANLIQRLGAMNSGLQVKNELVNLFGIDLHDFFHFAFTDTWHDLGGRQFFWNFYIKSMTWGEFNWGPVEPFARVWNIFCLFLVIYLIFAFRFYYQKEDGVRIQRASLKMPLITILFCVISSFVYRLIYPLSPMQDFRFLFPVIFPLGVLFVRFSDAISIRFTQVILGFATILLAIIWIKVIY